MEIQHPHEEGIFLARNEILISLLILRLMQEARISGRSLRISILSTMDTNIPFKRKRKYRYDDEYQLIVTADQDPEITKNYIVLTRLLQGVEDREDRPSNRTEQKVEGLTNDKHTFVLSQEALKRFEFITSLEDSCCRIEITVPQQGGKSYIGFIICPEYLDEFVQVMQQTSKS